MDVVIRSDNNPVKDIATHVSGLINEIDRVADTKNT